MMQPGYKFDFTDTLKAIKQADLPDAEKLIRAFKSVTDQVITLYEQDVEVARAIQDKDLLVKNQIKLEVVKSARLIFASCYTFVLDRSAEDA